MTFLSIFTMDQFYDYHFIINELVKQFEGELSCLEGNMEKYIDKFSSNRKRNLVKENTFGKRGK